MILCQKKFRLLEFCGMMGKIVISKKIGRKVTGWQKKIKKR